MVTFNTGPIPPYDGEGRPPYDTLAGVENLLKSLESLNLLISLRAANGKGDVKLNTFYLFGGKIKLDQFGQLFLGPNVKFENPPPNVMTEKMFRDFCETNSQMKKVQSEYGITFSHAGFIPSATVVCPYCMDGWSIENFRNFYPSERDLSPAPLTAFVGRTIGYFFEKRNKSTDAMYIPRVQKFLRNDKCKDGTKQFSEEAYGFFEPESSFYLIQPGDEISLSKVEIFHPECLHLQVTHEQKSKIFDIARDLDFTDIEMEEIPNEYSGYPFDSKWFLLKSMGLTIKIGRRKRVFNIEVMNGDLLVDFNNLFPNEEVTKGKNYIHAYTYEKLKEYLRVIRETLAVPN